MNSDRIMVVGCPGSGKTTFATRLGKILGREVIHLDKLLWLPDWQMMDYSQRKEIHDGIIGNSQWIIDGMWRSHVAERIERATAVFFLDYPRCVCMMRAIKRRIRFHGKQRYDIAHGCKEKLDGYFLKYIYNFRRNVRPYLVGQLQLHAEHLDLVTFRRPKEAEKFLADMEQRYKSTVNDIDK